MDSSIKELCLAALKKHFGFDGFLDNQEGVVHGVLQGEDLCVVMPTGAGKSLCYQLPILMSEGYGIVVSPLISLMKDQVDGLREKGVAAACVNSSISLQEQLDTLRDAAEGRVKILYVAPERLQLGSFKGLLERRPPSMLIVDEAHCISQWGHDFRPAYARIGETVKESSIKQVCAFTATATPKVREDIMAQLERPSMRLLVAGFKRPNLAFSALNCRSASQKPRELAKLLEKRCPTIIYASTRKAVEEVSGEFGCIAYHAGLPDAKRNEAQDRFMNDPCPVLVATNAFGMGIDRPDVRRVIHYNIPGSLEAYYQEAGRAGRDGEPAECILLNCYADRFVQEFLIDLNNPSEEIVRGLHAALLALAEKKGTDTLEVSLAELLPSVSGAKSEAQLGGAMKILERYDWVERGFRQQNAGTLKFKGSVDSIAALHQAESTQRSRFIHRCALQFGQELSSGVLCSYAKLSSVAGLSVDQVQRVIKALDGNCLEWTPPFPGRTTTLLKTEQPALDIDFKALKRKRDFEISRLDEVLNYAKTSECRQKFLISYFGEDSEDWQCENCDVCCAAERSSLRDPTPYEKEVVKTILRTVKDLDGRFGMGKISLVLAGAKRPEIIDWRLDNHRSFGALRKLKQNNVLLFMKRLESAGLLGRSGNPEYPCVELTPAGLEALAEGKPVKLDFPELAGADVEKAPRRAPKLSSFRRVERDGDDASPGQEGLYESLRKLRAEMARKRRVPAFQILTDATLREVVERLPESVGDALEIKGIGDRKAMTIMPAFIDAISAWRKNS